MIKTLLSHVRQYKGAALLTPVWTTAEVVMGVLIPLGIAVVGDGKFHPEMIPECLPLFLGIALIMAGHSLNSTDPQDLEDAKQLLIEQKPMVLAYVVDEVKDKMIGGEAAVALVWSGDATFCMDENDELDYVVPEEGSNIFFDAICIPANAKNVSGAEKFIDFLCRADIAAKNYEYVGYAIPNVAAIDELGAEEYNASPVNNPPQEVLDKCEVFHYLGDDTKLYDQIWTEIISEF